MSWRDAPDWRDKARSDLQREKAMADDRRTAEPQETGDAFLRQMGFKIVARPKDAVPVWRKGLVEVSEPRARRIAERELEVKSNLDQNNP